MADFGHAGWWPCVGPLRGPGRTAAGFRLAGSTGRGRQVVALMEEFGLKLGEEGLEIYVMAEIPSNVILAKEFAEVFDGFFIGSNDLTQLTLGIDRDSAIVSHLFDERNEAVTQLLAQVIGTAKACGRPIGLCGQAPIIVLLHSCALHRRCCCRPRRWINFNASAKHSRACRR